MRKRQHETIRRYLTLASLNEFVNAQKAFSLALLLASLVMGCLPQSTSQAAQQSVSRKPGLRLTTRIVAHKYCSRGGMLLTLASEYTNMGDQNLILFKYALPAFQYMVSKNAEAARTKHYEQVISPTMGYGPSNIQFGNAPPPDYFVLLRPQQSYTPVNTINVLVITTDVDKEVGKDDLRPGDHVLQLNVSTWPLEDNLVAKLQNRWQQFGRLWTKPVLSVPMTFRIAGVQERSRSDCTE